MLSTIRRLAAIAALAALPVGAQAVVYKCQQANGSYTFQDQPCPTGSTAQGTVRAAPGAAGSGAGLAGMLSEAAMGGLRTMARKAQQGGHLPIPVANCLVALSPSSLDNTFSMILNDQLTQDERRTAEVFYASPAGRKLSQQGMAVTYARMGLGSDATAPLSAAEEQQVAEFRRTDAGQKLLVQNVLDQGRAREALMLRTMELLRSCGVQG